MIIIPWIIRERCSCDDDDWDDDDGGPEFPDWLFYLVIVLFFSWMGGLFAWGQGWWNPFDLIDKFL